jgi:hypothetical protein
VYKKVILAFVRRFCRGPNFLVDLPEKFGQELATLQLMFTPGSSLVPKFGILECSGRQRY